MTCEDKKNGASVFITGNDSEISISFSGILNSYGIAQIWTKTIQAMSPEKSVKIDASKVEYLDGAGVALLTELKKQASGEFEITGLKKEYQQLFDLFSGPESPLVKQEEPATDLFTSAGIFIQSFTSDVASIFGFIGEVFIGSRAALKGKIRIRWQDAFVVMEKCGVNALPIIALLGFLIGLIMAFQGTIPMRTFGVEIYVADLVAISVIRELGPLMTAIILAGRSGSAFSAELGTMKVREEIDAFVTMGLSPVNFLALPRIIAAMLMTPILSVFMTVFALIGGAVVITSMGYIR